MPSYLLPDELMRLVILLLVDQLRSERQSIGKTLTNLALACRAFYDPAMDARWEVLSHGLGPLVMCLPDDAKQVIAVGAGVVLVNAIVR